MLKKSCLIFALFVLLISFISAYNSCSEVSSDVLNEGGVIRTCQNVTSCGTLSTANRYYLLLNDVVDNDTCIVFRNAHNSVFDLNGHTIIYNNLSLILNNPGFEESLSSANWQVVEGNSADVTRIYGPSVPDDDLTRADYMWGDYYLNIQNNGPTVVRSNLINIPSPSQTYVAWVTSGGRWSNCSTTFISVEDEFGTELCRMERSPVRTFSLFCSFKPTTSVNVYVKFGTLDPVWNTPPDNCEGLGYDLTFDEAGLASSYDFGLVARPYSGIGRAPDDPVSTTNNLIIKNGNVVQGFGNGPYSQALEISTSPFLLRNVTSIVNGINTNNLYLQGGYHVITNNSFISHSPYVFNRMDILAQIKSDLQNSTIDSNFIDGGPQRGIDVGGDLNITISNNIIRQNATVTNNHAAGAYGGTNLYFINNTIQPHNGRGISCEHVNGCYVYNNTINVTEIPSMEYYHNFVFSCAHGIKIEGSAQNVYIVGNNVTSSSGPLTWGGCPLNLGQNDAGGYVEIKNNSFTALYGPGSRSETWASSLYYYGPVDEVFIEGNNFYSNHRFVEGLTPDSGTSFGPTVVSNTFTKINPEIPTFHSIVFNGDSNRQNIETVFINTSLIGGEYTDARGIRSDMGVWNFDVRWFLEATVLQGGNPVEGVFVSIFDKNNILINSFPTGAGGNVFVNLSQFFMSGVSTSLPTQTNSSPYTINVTHLGETQSQVVDLDSSKEIIFYFGGSNPDVNGDGHVDVIDLSIVIFNQGRNAMDPNYEHLDLNEDGDIDWNDVIVVVNNL